ncbi:MAG: EamA family transporter RarD [Chloroflexia bacterium]|nr:EamA family transporter RarD [Chloroflexia bacterium]
MLETNKGAWYAVGAYTIWGLLPVYWKWLQDVPPPQVLGHRIVWSFVCLAAVIWLLRRGRAFRAAALQRRVLGIYILAALLIGVNWLTYIWAVNAGFIVETSLGYFINPLLNIALGVVLFRERLRWGQWTAVGLAAAGVLYLTLVYGTFPWISLTLALSFGLYGLVKKTAPLGSLYGLTLETGLLFLPALAYLGFAEGIGQGSFLHAGPVVNLLLLGAGPMTTIPLLMFAAAVRRIPLAHVGVLQYIAPTLQFLLGVLVYHEPFPLARLVGFGIVWVGLIVFVLENIMARRPAAPSAA